MVDVMISRKKYNGQNKQYGAFSRIEVAMQKSAAFQSLSASAIRVLLWAITQNFKSATRNDFNVKPDFKMTNVEAKKNYNLNSATFTKAKKQLEDRGFIEWVQRGGLKGCNGVCSRFCLSSKWKDWVAPPKIEYNNLKKARTILKQNREEREKDTVGYGKILKSIKPDRLVNRRNHFTRLNS